MSNSSPIKRAPTSIPRPSPTSGLRPRLVSLPSAELVEVPRAKPPSIPPPLPSKRPAAPLAPIRADGNDIMDRLFDALAGLDSQPDAIAAARLCLEALSRVLPCRTMIVHAFDLKRKEFLVVHARGEAAESMILERHMMNDPLLRVAMPTGEPFAWNDLRKAPVGRLARFAELGQVTTVLVCPIMAGIRWLGAIELVDPIGGAPFRTRDILGARYAMRRYADFVKSQGLILDVGHIARIAARGSAR